MHWIYIIFRQFLHWIYIDFALNLHSHFTSDGLRTLNQLPRTNLPSNQSTNQQPTSLYSYNFNSWTNTHTHTHTPHKLFFQLLMHSSQPPISLECVVQAITVWVSWTRFNRAQLLETCRKTTKAFFEGLLHLVYLRYNSVCMWLRVDIDYNYYHESNRVICVLS